MGDRKLHPKDAHKRAGGRIQSLLAERDTAYLEGVKAGLEAALVVIAKAFVEACDEETGVACALAILEKDIRALNPATITREEG